MTVIAIASIIIGFTAKSWKILFTLCLALSFLYSWWIAAQVYGKLESIADMPTDKDKDRWMKITIGNAIIVYFLTLVLSIAVAGGIKLIFS